MPGFVVQIEGYEKAARALEALPLKLQRKVLRPAMRDGAKVIATAATREALTSFGSANPAPHLADTIRVRAGRGKRGEIRLVVTTGKRSELDIPELTKSGTPRGYYPTALEFGWTPGLNRRSELNRLADSLRASPGSRRIKRGSSAAAALRAAKRSLDARKVPGNPFMLRAFNASAAAAKEAIGQGIGNRIQEAVV